MLLAALTAAAALSTGQFGICVVLSATGVDFGTYDPIGANATAPRDATGQIEYLCFLASPRISLSPGGAGSYQPRLLRQGARTLGYNLYRDARRTEVWGNGSGGTVAFSGRIGWETIPIYGRLFSGQIAAAGSYADIVLATFNF